MMIKSLKSKALSFWNENPKFKGLQIMVLGFLGAIIGAGLAILGGMGKEPGASTLLGLIASGVLYTGATVMLVGSVAMVAGIVIHWMSIFSRG